MFRGAGRVEDGRNIFVLQNILSSHKTQLVARQKKMNRIRSVVLYVDSYIYTVHSQRVGRSLRVLELIVLFDLGDGD